MVQLDDEVHVDFLRMKLLNEVAGRFHRSACCEQIVVKQYDVVACYGVFMNLDGVGPILLLISLLHGVAGKLARLAAQYDACA